jgi:hypothetical protein
MERAHETMEHHGHGHSKPDPWARGVAVLISVLAAALAVTEIGEKASQTGYLTHHVAVSDAWSFYQAKNMRAAVKDTEAQLLASLPNTAEPAVQARIKEAQDYAARMRDDPQGGDGMKQLAQRARAEEAARNEAYHRYHNYEYAAGALEIAIVLASVSVITRARLLTLVAVVIGALAGLGAGGIALNMF